MEEQVQENQEAVPAEDVQTVAQEQVQENQEAVPSVLSLASLIINLHKTLDQGISLVKEYQHKLREVNERHEALNKTAGLLEDQSKSMNQREFDCQQVENVQKLHQDAKALHNAANLRLEAAVEAERKLHRATEEQMSKLAEERLVTQREANNVLKAKKNIEEEVNIRVKKALTSLGVNQNVTASDDAQG